MLHWYQFIHRDEQAQALADQVARDIEHIFQQKDRVILCVPGGNTPAVFLSALSNKIVDWNKVIVILNDERWVDLDDAQSNEANLRKKLNNNAAVGVHIIGYYPSTTDRTELSVDHAIEQFNQSHTDLLQPDICVLGMGEDGHFASLFPRMPNLETALDSTQKPALLSAKPEGKEQRVSLNLSAILCAKKQYLLITGKTKKHIVDKAQEKRDLNYPISYLLQATTVTIYYAD